MTGGTLIVSRNIDNHGFFKNYLEDKGYKNIDITDAERDGLNYIINDKKPDLVMIQACFYECCTPYMISELLEIFPKLNIAAVNIYNYPDELAMLFIHYGVNSYVSLYEGRKEFYKGLMIIRDGKYYVSPKVQERINSYNEMIEPTGKLTPRQIELIRLICCGFNNSEIGDVLHITRKTAYTHRNRIFKIMNVRSNNELMRAALYLKAVNIDELYFYPKQYTEFSNPKKYHYGGKNVNQNEKR